MSASRYLRDSLFASFAIAISVLNAAGQSDAARIVVAKIDGTPAYHWRAFEHIYRYSIHDDIDRALAIREFYRGGYDVPDRIVNEVLRNQLDQHFGGDASQLNEKLRRDGVTLQDYKRFLKKE